MGLRQQDITSTVDGTTQTASIKLSKGVLTSVTLTLTNNIYTYRLITASLSIAGDPNDQARISQHLTHGRIAYNVPLSWSGSSFVLESDYLVVRYIAPINATLRLSASITPIQQISPIGA